MSSELVLLLRSTTHRFQPGLTQGQESATGLRTQQLLNDNKHKITYFQIHVAIFLVWLHIADALSSGQKGSPVKLQCIGWYSSVTVNNVTSGEVRSMCVLVHRNLNGTQEVLVHSLLIIQITIILSNF